MIIALLVYLFGVLVAFLAGIYLNRTNYHELGRMPLYLVVYSWIIPAVAISFIVGGWISYEKINKWFMKRYEKINKWFMKRKD